VTNSTKDPIVCFEHSTSQKNGDIKAVCEHAPGGFDCTFVLQQTNKSDDAEGGDTKFGMDKAPVINKRCFGACSSD